MGSNEKDRKSCTRMHHCSTHIKVRPWSRLWLIVPFTGLVALIWFLIRVIPKPSRAAYPCQMVAAPLASGFVLWLISIFTSAFAWTRHKQLLAQSRWRWAALCLAVCVVSAVIALVHTPEKAAFADPQPNVVVGTAKGIHPGRVVWCYSPGAASWDGVTGYWFDRANTNQAALEKMLSQAICNVAGSPYDFNDTAAWQAIFMYFNNSMGKGNIGYSAGEKILIKVNLVECTPNSPNNAVDANYNQVMYLQNTNNTSPYLILALIKQLVNFGVNQHDIWVGDTTDYFPKHYWNICHGAYPNVNYFDYGGKFGRIRPSPSAYRVYWGTTNSNGCTPDYVPDCYANASYIINMPPLKAHTPGVSLCGKNNYGSFGRFPWGGLYWNSAATYYNWHLDLPISGGTFGMGKYRNIVDMMGHSQIGGKTILCIIDGFWGGYGATGPATPQTWNIKWNMPPFNGNWPSSLFVSQDPVAIDSVGYDFLWAEEHQVSANIEPYKTNQYIEANGGDDYLYEAAEANNPPSGSIYSPDGPGKQLSSLGVHEHWNNYIDKQYSRNLGTGNGIELVRVDVVPIAGDLNGDYDVDFTDFAIFGEHWLQTGCSAANNWCGGAAINEDSTVSFADLDTLLEDWLVGFLPTPTPAPTPTPTPAPTPIPPASLVSHWTLNGTLNDSVGTNTLTNVGGSFSSATIPALGGTVQVLDLTAANAYAWNSAPTGLNTSTFTIAAFVYAPAILTNGRITARSGYSFDTSTQCFAYAPTFSNWRQVGSGLTTSSWQAVAWVVDDSIKKVSMYINGALQTGSSGNSWPYTYSGTVSPAGAFYLGISKDLNNNGQIKIADVGYFNTALSQTDIQTIAQYGIAGL